MMRRGALRPPGLGHMDPYLEAARRYAGGVPPPFSCKNQLFFIILKKMKKRQLHKMHLT